MYKIFYGYIYENLDLLDVKTTLKDSMEYIYDYIKNNFNLNLIPYTIIRNMRDYLEVDYGSHTSFFYIKRIDEKSITEDWEDYLHKI